MPAKPAPETQLAGDADFVLTTRDLELRYLARFLPSARGWELFAQLRDATDWTQHRLRLFGKDVPEPRLSAWYGEQAYRYSGQTRQPLAWTPLLADLCRQVEAASGARYNAVLLNLYRDGGDSMGLHSDDESELGPAPTIASVSLGAVRRFVLRHRTAPLRYGLELAHGSLLVMAGPTQQAWKHGLPKAAGAQARINLTFRWLE